MPLMVAVQVTVVDAVTGQGVIDVFNRETVHVIPSRPDESATVLKAVMERLCDDVKERAGEQVRDSLRTS